MTLCLIKEMDAIRAVLGRDLPNWKPREIKNRIRTIAETFGDGASKETAMAMRRAIQAAGAVVATS